MLDTWIYAKPADWAAIDPEDKPYRYAYDQAITGYWKAYTGGYEVYNLIAPADQIAALVEDLGDVAHTFCWHQGNGLDALDPSEYQTIPDEVLAVMADHVTYDENGDVVSTEAATREIPNWGHQFLGQKERIFAGDFDPDDFEGDYL